MRVLVELLDHQSGEFVEAELFDEVTMDHFLETQREWRPVVTEAALYLAKAGAKPILVPRHFHWDWTKKEADLRMLAITFYGLGCGGALQGSDEAPDGGTYRQAARANGKASRLRRLS